jgi:hypothetical protein
LTSCWLIVSCCFSVSQYRLNEHQFHKKKTLATGRANRKSQQQSHHRNPPPQTEAQSTQVPQQRKAKNISTGKSGPRKRKAPHPITKRLSAINAPAPPHPDNRPSPTLTSSCSHPLTRTTDNPEIPQKPLTHRATPSEQRPPTRSSTQHCVVSFVPCVSVSFGAFVLVAYQTDCQLHTDGHSSL